MESKRQFRAEEGRERKVDEETVPLVKMTTKTTAVGIVGGRKTAELGRTISSIGDPQVNTSSTTSVLCPLRYNIYLLVFSIV